MPHDRFLAALANDLAVLDARGNPKRHELVIEGVVPAAEGYGPRYRVAGRGGELFLKMNSNNYLGMNLRREVIEAEEEASRKYGAGPGAVRFISGTYAPHIELEATLARFHGREAAMIGEVVAEHAGRVMLRSRIGGTRVVDMLSGEQLPRIC